MTRNPREQRGKTTRAFSAIRENGPAAAVAVIAFTGSFSHIVAVCHQYGMPGLEAYPVAAVVDLMCIMGAEERQRDKRIGRQRKGWMSWPTVILCLGVGLTLAINEAIAQHTAWGRVVAAIAPVAMLLAVSVLERRASWQPVPAAAGSGSRMAAVKPPAMDAAGSRHRAAPAAEPPAEPVAEPAAAQNREPVPAASAGERRDSARKPGMDELTREARKIIADHAARNSGGRPSWAALGLQLRVSKATAGEVLKLIDEQDAGGSLAAVPGGGR